MNYSDTDFAKEYKHSEGVLNILEWHHRMNILEKYISSWKDNRY